MLPNILQSLFNHSQELLLLGAPLKWALILYGTGYAVKLLLQVKMRFLAAGIVAPVLGLALLAVLAQENGPIPVTSTLITGFMAMVSFQFTCLILGLQEMAFNDSSLARRFNA